MTESKKKKRLTKSVVKSLMQEDHPEKPKISFAKSMALHPSRYATFPPPGEGLYETNSGPRFSLRHL